MRMSVDSVREIHDKVLSALEAGSTPDVVLNLYDMTVMIAAFEELTRQAEEMESLHFRLDQMRDTIREGQHELAMRHMVLALTEILGEAVQTASAAPMPGSEQFLERLRHLEVTLLGAVVRPQMS